MAEARLTLIEKTQILEQCSDSDPVVALARRLGPELWDQVLEVAGGEKLPEREWFWGSLWRRIRDEQLRAAFQGDNLEELALRFDLSTRQVRRIVCDG